MFTAKLPGSYTHERGKATAVDERLLREGMDALAAAGKLGAVLVQFLVVKNTDDERLYHPDYWIASRTIAVLEVRHSSWNNLKFTNGLDELEVGICNVDQTVVCEVYQPAAETTPDGYVRLHGRNTRDWFREKAPRDDRYNYLYSMMSLTVDYENKRDCSQTKGVVRNY